MEHDDHPMAGPELTPPLTVTAGGLQLAYRTMGPLRPDAADRLPLVLLHGFGGDMNAWVFNHARWAATRRVVAPDLPGHGLSEKRVDPDLVGWFPDRIDDFLDAIACARPIHLVGHSMGGLIALAHALGRPDQVAALTLIAPAGIGDHSAADWLSAYLAADGPAALSRVLPSLFADPGFLTPEMLAYAEAARTLPGRTACLQAIAGPTIRAGRAPVRLRSRLDELAMPAQMIWGLDDAILPVEAANDLPGSIAVHRLPGVGHMPQMEAPSVVTDLIDRFG